MPTLYATRGLPGSGKTTYAKAWVAVSPETRARINRDDLRDLAHGGYVGQDTEKQIMVIRDAAISALLKRGIDVICDDTNLPSRTIRDLRKIAVLAGAEFEIFDFTNVAVETCASRDYQRALDTNAKLIGRVVIQDMYDKYIKGKGYPLPVVEEPAVFGDGAPYVPRKGTPKAVLVDIDGTVTLGPGTRSPFDETRVHEDRPNLPVIYLVQKCIADGNQIIFCSGRTSGCRDATTDWLNEHVLGGVFGLLDYFESANMKTPLLYMRAEGDMRKDSVVKLELFNEHIRDKYNVLCVIDDRKQVVDMWRSIGLTVLQCAEGNF